MLALFILCSGVAAAGSGPNASRSNSALISELAHNHTSETSIELLLGNSTRSINTTAKLRGSRTNKTQAAIDDNRRIGGPGSTDFSKDNLETEVEDEAKEVEKDLSKVGEEVEKDVVALERHVVKNIWEPRDFQHPAHQGDVDVTQGWLLLASIFLVCLTLQIYLGGWNCAGGRLQKGDEEQRKRAKSVSQFGAIMMDKNGDCEYKKVNNDIQAGDINNRDPTAFEMTIDCAPPSPAVSPRDSNECSIELVDFSSLPSADSPRSPTSPAHVTVSSPRFRTEV